MAINGIIESLRSVIGEAPAGLEFLEYLFAVILVVFGLVSILSIIKSFFGIFIK